MGVLQKDRSEDLVSNPEISAQSIRAIYMVKAAALGLIFVTYWLIQLYVSAFTRSGEISLVIVAAMLGAVAVLVVPHASRLLLRASLVIDVLALSTGVHLAGGVDNVSMPLLYPAIISLAGILLTGADAFAIAILSVVSYAAVVLGEYSGLLPHLVEYSRPPHRQLSTMIPVGICLLMYAWLVSFAMERVRSLYRQTEAVRRDAMHALSHDLKNPLSVIHGYARLMQTASALEREQFGPGIERTAQQALDLVSNVLDASALDGRPITPRLHPVRLDELVGDVTDRYRHAAAAANIRLESEIADGMPPADVDGQLIARALGNLISNAIKYGGNGGSVRVSTAASNGRVSISVSDSGAGIARDELPLLFRRYSRTSSARGIEGSGLGLFIVRCIVEAHRGRVQVASTPGKGSTFTLELPAKKA